MLSFIAGFYGLRNLSRIPSELNDPLSREPERLDVLRYTRTSRAASRGRVGHFQVFEKQKGEFILRQ